MYDTMQSACHKFYSTETLLLKVHSDVLKALDRDFTLVLIMLDLSVAFDTIKHEVMFTPLNKWYNVKCQVLKWIQAYLKNWTRKVIVNDHQSQMSI